MNPIQPDEAAEVMTILTALDRWLQVTPDMATIWAAALNAAGVRLDDARTAAQQIIITRAKGDATPGLLIAEVRALRDERLKAVGDDLIPPDDLPLDARGRSQYPAWLRAAKSHVGDGLTADDAMAAADMDLGCKRRQITPTAGPRGLAATVTAGAAAEARRTA